MKITKFILRNLKVPLKHPYELSKTYGVQQDTSNIIIEMHTDEGYIGWGECDPWPAFTGDTDLSVITILEKLICPELIGYNPLNIDDIHKRMDFLIKANYTAKAGIDMACYDIKGKRMNMPVHRLLGGKIRNSIKCFWAVGGSTPEDTAKEVLLAKERGFWGCMIKIGNDYQNDIVRTIATREAVGSSFPIIADANQGWDIDTAIAYAKGVESANLLFFEQPVKYWDIEGLKIIRNNISIPISADESILDIHDAKSLVENEACDYFSIKISKMGGFKPSLDICKYASDNNVKLFFNSMVEQGISQASSLQLASTVNNILNTTGHSFFSTMRLKGDITDFYSWTKKGITYVSDKPGLGIFIDYQKLDEYTVNILTIK